jgi:hypothetical protein
MMWFLLRHTGCMSLSPRVRPDFLLLHDAPTPLQCLEVFATEQGVEFCKPYPNIVAKASKEFPKLPELIASHMSPELVAYCVCAALDGVVVDTNELPLPGNLLAD